MIVYDIIQHVEPHAQTSWPKGSRWLESRDRKELAESTADNYNRFACPGVSYTVEEIDELSPDRKLP